MVGGDYDPRVEFYRFWKDFEPIWDRFFMIFSWFLTCLCIKFGVCLNKSALTSSFFFQKLEQLRINIVRHVSKDLKRSNHFSKTLAWRNARKRLNTARPFRGGAVLACQMKKFRINLNLGPTRSSSQYLFGRRMLHKNLVETRPVAQMVLLECILERFS